MKLLIVLSGLLCLSWGKPFNNKNIALEMERKQEMGLECMKQVGIERDVIEAAKASLILPKTDTKYKDFLACSYKKQGYMQEDGTMNMENLISFVSNFYNKNDLLILNKCKNVEGATHGDVAINALECILAYLKIMKENKSQVESNDV